jgi:hypothetical protein
MKTTFAKRQTSLLSDPPHALTAARFASSEAKANQWKAFIRKSPLMSKLI